MNEPLFEIVTEDADLLVVNKPAGLVCHPTKTDERSSLIGRARLHLGPTGEARLVNRLDRETSGLVVIAKNATAARDLGRQWETRQVRKEYLAIVHGHVNLPHTIIDAPLGKDIQSRVAIKDCVRPDGSPAQTEVTLLRVFEQQLPGGGRGSFSLVRLRPLTGRKHQIRIHLAHSGHAIVGDKIYGPDEDCYLALVEDRVTPEQRAQLILPHHALAATSLAFEFRGTKLQFEATPEAWFRAFVPGFLIPGPKA
jgi:23S rRNA pseudouridine1911/1915/1917 synthase